MIKNNKIVFDIYNTRHLLLFLIQIAQIKQNIKISTDKARLNLPMIHYYLTKSYWTGASDGEATATAMFQM